MSNSLNIFAPNFVDS